MDRLSEIRRQSDVDDEIRKIIDERMQLLDTIKEMVSDEVDRRIKEMFQDWDKRNGMNIKPAMTNHNQYTYPSSG